jgi:hypothetical protein
MSDSQTSPNDVIKFLLKKFSNPKNNNAAYQLEGYRYCQVRDKLVESEVYSADPNYPKWETYKFKYMDAFYEGKILEPVGIFEISDTDRERYTKMNLEDFAMEIINQSQVENKLISSSAFIFLLEKAQQDSDVKIIERVT